MNSQLSDDLVLKNIKCVLLTVCVYVCRFFAEGGNGSQKGAEWAAEDCVRTEPAQRYSTGTAGEKE